MKKNPEGASEQYRNSNVMTAGKVKSVELLLEKASHLLSPPDEVEEEEMLNNIRQVRNILTQLQMSLNLKNGEAAVHIFEVYELAQKALEDPSEKSLDVARYLIRDLLKTIRLAFGH